MKLKSKFVGHISSGTAITFRGSSIHVGAAVTTVTRQWRIRLSGAIDRSDGVSILRSFVDYKRN
jgi:sarcosine oxidase gamma subunit